VEEFSGMREVMPAPHGYHDVSEERMLARELGIGKASIILPDRRGNVYAAQPSRSACYPLGFGCLSLAESGPCRPFRRHVAQVLPDIPITAFFGKCE
jgi:hypothetical protein